MNFHFRVYALVFSVLLGTAPCFANGPEPQSRRIQAAVMLEDRSEPIIGETRCKINAKCQVVSSPSSGFFVEIVLRSGTDISGEMIVRCPKDCSFKSRRSRIDFQEERKFDLFNGADDSVHSLLVMRTKTKLGEILLIVE